MADRNHQTVKIRHEIQLEHPLQHYNTDPKAPGIQNLVIDAEAEKRLRRGFDYRVLPFGVLIYLFSFIDRTNMGNARVLGMEEDADLHGSRFNLTLTAFYISYIVFEMYVDLSNLAL
jgi:hypothetical protein